MSMLGDLVYLESSNVWTGRFPRGQPFRQLYSTVIRMIKQNSPTLTIPCRHFSCTTLHVATANKGPHSHGTPPSGRWLRRQPVSSNHANREAEHAVRYCLADASQPRQSALLERVNKKHFLPCLLRGQGTSKGALE